MSKTKAKSSSTRKCPTLDEMKAKLMKQCKPSGVKLAEKMVLKYRPEIILLAYRLLPKTNASRLSAREEKIYADLRKKNVEIADSWKKDRLAEKAAK